MVPAAFSQEKSYCTYYFLSINTQRCTKVSPKSQPVGDSSLACDTCSFLNAWLRMSIVELGKVSVKYMHSPSHSMFITRLTNKQTANITGVFFLYTVGAAGRLIKLMIQSFTEILEAQWKPHFLYKDSYCS